MKKILITIIVILCIAAGSHFIYINVSDQIFTSSEFPENTYINGIECSGMTVPQAADNLTEKWNSNSITFTENHHTVGSLDITGISYNIEDALENIRKDYYLSTALNSILGTRLDMTLKMKVSGSNETFNKALIDAGFLKENDITETSDAYIDINDPDMPVIKEVYGNNTDYDLLKEKLFTTIEDGIFNFYLVKSEFYEQPSITADSEVILEQQEFYRTYLKSNIRYSLGKDTVTISPAQMAEIRGVTLDLEDGLNDSEISAVKKAVAENIILEDKVKEYVAQFAEEYNTLYSTRDFKTSTGKTVTIVGGDYGFALDQENEYLQLMKDLKGNKTVKRDPMWALTGFTDYSIGNDVGNTYVEVSIKDQHLWYYKDGKIIVDCDIVTGNPYMGYSTPTGTFGLTYKQLGATLKGENADGTEYESPVTYWMPFYGNYGMHDATWRYSFGGNIYLGGGSHGCVNMPLKSAEKLFNNLADSNVPVVVYDN